MRFITLLLTFFILATLDAQNNTTTIIVSNTGPTIEIALRNCMRSAVEQNFGVYLTSSTSIVNDDVLMDAVSTVSNGAISSYEIKSQTQISNGDWAVTAKIVVSPSIAFNIIKSKGYKVEFAGSNISSALQLQQLNENSELEIMKSLVETSKLYLQNLYSYKIAATEPKKIYTRGMGYGDFDANFENKLKSEVQSKFQGIGLRNNNSHYFSDYLQSRMYAEDSTAKSEYYYQFFSVSAFPNDNFLGYIKFLTESLKDLSLNKNGIKDYFKVGKRIYPIKLIRADNKEYIFFFRTEKAVSVFRQLMIYMEKNKDNFRINNGYKNLIIGQPFSNKKLVFDRYIDQYQRNGWRFLYSFEKKNNYVNFERNEVIFSREFGNENSNFSYIESYQSLENDSYFPTWNFKGCSTKIAVADYCLVDAYTTNNLNRISNFSISDGLLYQGKVVSAKKNYQNELQREKTKESGRNVGNTILGYILLFSLLYLGTLFK